MQNFLKFSASAAIWIVALLTTGVFITGCDKKAEKEPEIETTLVLSVSTLDFQYAGGTQSFTVTSNADVWNVAFGSATWLTVTPVNGSKDGTVSVLAAANTVSTAREATITVTASGAASKTIKVTQAAAPAITLVLSTDVLNFESAAATKTFNITSNATAWNISSSATAWLTVTPATGSNNGTASAKTTANTTTKPREATITVSGTGVASQTVKVTQAAPTLNQTWRTLLQTAMSTSTTYTWDDGTRYKGQMDNLGLNGLGACWWLGGGFHIGGWKNTQGDGYGIYSVGDYDVNSNVADCPDCKIYVGNYLNHDRSGMGAYYDKTGARIYYGELKDNKPVGTYPTAPDYNNTFEITRANDGSYYLVENVQGKRNGYGMILYANRDMWYGTWKDGIRDGYGIQIYANGTLRLGTWKGDTYTATTRSQSAPTVQQPLSPVAAPALGAPAQ